MLLKNIQMHCSNLLKFVYIAVFDDETALENAKFLIWKFPLLEFSGILQKLRL